MKARKSSRFLFRLINPAERKRSGEDVRWHYVGLAINHVNIRIGESAQQVGQPTVVGNNIAVEKQQDFAACTLGAKTLEGMIPLFLKKWTCLGPAITHLFLFTLRLRRILWKCLFHHLQNLMTKH